MVHQWGLLVPWILWGSATKKPHLGWAMNSFHIPQIWQWGSWDSCACPQGQQSCQRVRLCRGWTGTSYLALLKVCVTFSKMGRMVLISFLWWSCQFPPSAVMKNSKFHWLSIVHIYLIIAVEPRNSNQGVARYHAFVTVSSPWGFIVLLSALITFM